MANQYLPHYTPTTPAQLFPQPQGNVYMINNSLEVANIPIGAGLSFAYCANEGLLYIKALQNGNPIFLTYRMTPYEGKQAEPTPRPPVTGDVTVQLNGNGSAIPGAISTVNSTAATDIGNLSFTAIVRVLPNCCAIQSNSPLTLTVENTGVEATYSNAAITITRLA